MQRDSNGGHKIPDINPNWPMCGICRDQGLIGGDSIEFRYCLCPAGVRLRFSDAAAIVTGLEEAVLPEANRKRAELLDRLGN